MVLGFGGLGHWVWELRFSVLGLGGLREMFLGSPTYSGPQQDYHFLGVVSWRSPISGSWTRETNSTDWIMIQVIRIVVRLTLTRAPTNNPKNQRSLE